MENYMKRVWNHVGYFSVRLQFENSHMDSLVLDELNNIIDYAINIYKKILHQEIFLTKNCQHFAA
jgi:hypothetical protein